MIHLSRFVIGIRHNRLFRVRSLSGELVDNFLKDFPNKFNNVSETKPNYETILINSNDTLVARFNLDDLIFESRKVYDLEQGSYIEISRQTLVDMAIKSLPTLTECLKLNDDYARVGIVFEFRIPKWESLTDTNFSAFIVENFINFPKKGEIGEGTFRMSYKLPASGGGLLKHLEDYKNIIIHINESSGINEKGKEEKCLFISVDGQHIFKPFRKSVDINEHYNFVMEHLKTVILPFFKDKGIEIKYE